MANGRPTWGVVATVDEPAPLVAGFVAHHLCAGASEVQVFLDRPDPETETLLADVPGCLVSVCDAAYWATGPLGRRPASHTDRQSHNADRAYASGRMDWLLHCDADEFLLAEGPLADELAAQGPEPRFAIIRNIERTWMPAEPAASIFTNHFRIPTEAPDPEAEVIYGDAARYLGRGVGGHSVGKSIVPTGADYRMGIHSPRSGKGATRRPKGGRIETAALLHFDGLTPLHWAVKLTRRADDLARIAGDRHGAARAAQIETMIRLRHDPQAWAAFWRKVQGVTEAQRVILAELGVLIELDAGIAHSVAKVFPGRQVDLTPAGFDAALLRRESELIGRTGLR